MFNNHNRIKELEAANQQWQMWYQAQQMQQPQPQTGKKKAKKKAKSNNMSLEYKIWIGILILSFFSILIIKDWLTDVKTEIAAKPKTTLRK